MCRGNLFLSIFLCLISAGIKGMCNHILKRLVKNCWVTWPFESQEVKMEQSQAGREENAAGENRGRESWVQCCTVHSLTSWTISDLPQNAEQTGLSSQPLRNWSMPSFLNSEGSMSILFSFEYATLNFFFLGIGFCIPGILCACIYVCVLCCYK